MQGSTEETSLRGQQARWTRAAGTPGAALGSSKAQLPGVREDHHTCLGSKGLPGFFPNKAPLCFKNLKCAFNTCNQTDLDRQAE